MTDYHGITSGGDKGGDLGASAPGKKKRLCWQRIREKSESKSPNLSGLVIWIFWLLNIENIDC